MRKGIAAVVLILFAVAAHAQVNVPHTFNSGAAARASEVNANFHALANAINHLSARMDRVDGGGAGNASLSGTYRIFGFQTGLLADKAPGTVETITYSGTLSFAPDGMYSGSLDEFAHDLYIGNPGKMEARTTKNEPLKGRYAISQNSKLTLAEFGGPDGIDFYGAAGAHIFVATTQGENPPPNLPKVPMGTNTLLILVRTH